jgi:hypothetical protein
MLKTDSIFKYFQIFVAPIISSNSSIADELTKIFPTPFVSNITDTPKNAVKGRKYPH